MSFHREEHVGARTSANHSSLLEQRLLLRLSQAAAAFMGEIDSRQLNERTVAEYRTALWYFVEFLGCDPPVRELADETPAKFLDWLRITPISPRMSKTRPKLFSPAAVKFFFDRPPRKKTTQRLRCEQTVGKYWRYMLPFFEYLGMPTRLAKRGPGRKPNLDLPPALVPMRTTVVNWWRDTLTATAMPAATKRRTLPTAAQRRRVVLMQGLIYLTGLRTGEALAALRSDLEGHWLLIRDTKTHKPRIVYLNGLALGIAAALHADFRQKSLFDLGEESGTEKFLLGWSKTEWSYLELARDCTSPEKYDREEKRHQSMRRKLSTWMHRRDAVSEAAQLGHGSGVVFKNYLDYLRPLPKLLERYKLPDIGLEQFQWPQPVEAKVARPDRLFNEIRKIINENR